ncbi:MAG: hypothetical protein LC772_06570 [Chloroflexi bacterium]|nr:hypothetical protein [Chloroflexota bacterium]
MAKNNDQNDEQKNEPPAQRTIRLQHDDHIYNGTTYLRGQEHKVEPDVYEALRASEERSAERHRRERESAGQIQTIDGPLRVAPQGAQPAPAPLPDADDNRVDSL